mmetsp:Transcript_10616/g.22485  ORF Transcript_10616/g.22485 Transcript_10616/m.22485 type:complete len:345 (-) Transcript_10616:239-1273(-)
MVPYGTILAIATVTEATDSALYYMQMCSGEGGIMAKKGRRDYGEGHQIDETGVDSSSTDGALTATNDNDYNGRDNTSSVDRSSLHNKCITKDLKNSSLSSWPVALYIPNLMGYLRIILSFVGLKHALQQQFHNALNIWIAAALLDLVDGIAARKLNQSSQFGILLDIMADNILRTVIWISATIESSKSDLSWENGVCVWAAIIICLEWITMFCTQSNQTNQKEDQKKEHWKDVNQKSVETTESKRSPPFWVQAVFKNNFCSLPGVLAIYGLFTAPLGTYVWYADRSHKTTWLLRLLSERKMSILITISYVGRFLSAMVELWLCYDFFRGVVARERCQQVKQKGS